MSIGKEQAERDWSRGWLLLVPLLIGCSPSALQTGPAVSLPSGPARGSCESQGWYELAPASIEAQAATAAVFATVTYQAGFNGFGVFRAGSKHAEELEDVWPRLNEPRLQQLHEARIEPVDTASRHSLYWALGGTVGLAGGVGAAAAVENSNKSVAAVLGISGLVLGAVGVVGALVAQPTGQQQLEAEARRKLFFFPEDERAAVDRGVERNNLAVRQRCSR